MTVLSRMSLEEARSSQLELEDWQTLGDHGAGVRCGGCNEQQVFWRKDAVLMLIVRRMVKWWCYSTEMGSEAGLFPSQNRWFPLSGPKTHHSCFYMHGLVIMCGLICVAVSLLKLSKFRPLNHFLVHQLVYIMFYAGQHFSPRLTLTIPSFSIFTHRWILR